MSVELLDKKAQESEVGLSYEQNPFNGRVQNMVRAAFPMSDAGVGKVFATIKAKDKHGDQLRDAVEAFLSALMLMVEEMDLGADSRDFLESSRIQVGQAGANCIVAVPLDSTEIHQYLHEMIEKHLALLNDTGLRISGGIGLGLTLKNLVSHVHLHNPDQQKRCEQSRTVEEDQP